MKSFVDGYIKTLWRSIACVTYKHEHEQVFEWFKLRQAHYKDFDIEIDIDDGVDAALELMNREPENYNRLLYDMLNAKLGSVALPLGILGVLALWIAPLMPIFAVLAAVLLILTSPIEKRRDELENKMNRIELEYRCMGIFDNARG